jgi:hypothetical protein
VERSFFLAIVTFEDKVGAQTNNVHSVEHQVWNKSEVLTPAVRKQIIGTSSSKIEVPKHSTVDNHPNQVRYGKRIWKYLHSTKNTVLWMIMIYCTNHSPISVLLRVFASHNTLPFPVLISVLVFWSSYSVHSPSEKIPENTTSPPRLICFQSLLSYKKGYRA